MNNWQHGKGAHIPLCKSCRRNKVNINSKTGLCFQCWRVPSLTGFLSNRKGKK